MNPTLRKSISEALLESYDIPVHKSLPELENDEDVVLRSTSEVGKRIVCLFCLAGTANEQGVLAFIEYLKRYNLWGCLSPSEREYLESPVYGVQIHTDATWRIESLFLLMWAGSLVEKLPFPPAEANIDDLIDYLPSSAEEPGKLLRAIRIRTVEEIMDASDLIYRSHWASKRSEKIDRSVVREWHHAINWLTSHNMLNWDDVVTDT